MTDPGKQTLTMKAAQALKNTAPRLAEVPPEKLAAKIGGTILGLLIAGVGLATMVVAGYIMLAAKAASVLSLVLAGGGAVIFFIGGVTASKDVLSSLLNIATLFKTIWATVKPQPPIPPVL